MASEANPPNVRRLRLWAVAGLVCVALAPATVMAQAPQRTPIQVSKLGPQVGERVPDFSLKDQFGKTVTLQSIMGAKGAMLVFVRSADW
jgi:hypothetical protein